MRHLWIVAVGLVLGTSAWAGEDLFTNSYLVPPTFLANDQSSPARPTAKEKLEAAGISFPDGASAVYNPATSQLIVRNTKEQMELVGAYIDAIREEVEILIYLTVREAAFRGEWAELLKAQEGEPKPGSIETDELISTLFRFPEQAKGVEASVFDSLESFRAELAAPPKPLAEGQALAENEARRGNRQTASLSDPQFQIMIRRLSRMKGIKLHSLPALMARPGQPALSRTETQRYGIVATLGGDEHTVDLDLYLPEHGKALVGGGAKAMEPTIRTEVMDGGTVVVAEKNAKGESRLVFVTAQLMDPAGMHAPAGLRHWETQLVERADQHAEEASRLLADGQFAEAFELYGKAVALLPKHEFTEPRRESYWRQWRQAREAMPKMPKGTSDTGVHIVAEGETVEMISARLGLNAEALRTANRIGRTPLKQGQILLVPAEAEVEPDTKALLRKLIIPKVDFHDAPLLQAIATLQEEILRLHGDGLFPDAAPIFVMEAPTESHGGPWITLRLSNVPAAEALRYVVTLAQCRYEIEGREVRILPED